MVVGSASTAAVEFADHSMEQICHAAYWASTELAEERGRYSSYDGSLWSRTWWRMGGGATATEFSPAAKASMGHWDTQFDTDYATWLSSLPR